MSVTAAHIKETAAFIQKIYAVKPQTGIVLGSGLGNLVNEIIIDKEIPYGNIPHFPVSTVEGHHGKLIFGSLGEKKVVCMAGRFHFYQDFVLARTIELERLKTHRLVLAESNRCANLDGHDLSTL